MLDDVRLPTSGTTGRRSHDTPPGVGGILIQAAQQSPSAGIHIAANGEDATSFISYPALLDQAARILGGLRERGLRSGAKVALLLQRPGDFIPAFWACLLGRYVPCPLATVSNDHDRWMTHVSHVASLLDGPLFISVAAPSIELPASVDSIDLNLLRKGHPPAQLDDSAPNDLAILMLTSGSTGLSKAVALTHDNIFASMEGRASRQALSKKDKMFNWISFDHVAALLESHMVAVYVGAEQLHAEPHVILADPLRFLRLIARHRVSVAFAPNFLLGQINAALEAGAQGAQSCLPADLDLSCLRRIVTGGEANVVDTGRRFLKILATYRLNSSALWPAFGMTETCAASVYSDDFPERDLTNEIASVGLPISGLSMRVVGEFGEPQPEDEVGELEVSGSVVFSRYHNNDEATRSAFTEDGWFRTGDLGRIKEGRLTLVARSKDTIIVNGVNYFVRELETRLAQLPGIDASFIAAFPTRPKGADTEQLVILFSSTLQADDDVGMYNLVVAIRNTTIMLWGFRPTLIVHLARERFPKTSLGKIQRSLMRQKLERGDFDVDRDWMERIIRGQLGDYAAPSSNTETQVAGLFGKVLGINPSSISATTSFFDLGGTSLDILKLTHALQREFAWEATLPIILQNPTVRSLATRISDRHVQINTAYDPLIPLQLTGRKTPLFCVHPGNGEVLVLVNVAKYFVNDRPFYALRPSGFNRGEEPFKSFEEIVVTYLDAILKRQPCGPYAIAGYSLGCRIAFDIAKQLEARGQRVAFLGCIDWYPNDAPTGLTFDMPSSLAYVLGLIDRAKWEELGALLYPTSPMPDPCEYVFRFASPDRLAQLDLNLEKFTTWSRVAEAMEEILFTHIPSGAVENITVFCSDGMTPDYSALENSRLEWRSQLKRWDTFAKTTRYVDVPGQHQEIMFPKHVAAFQAVLRAEVDRALFAFER